MLLTAVGDDTVGEDLLRHAEDTGVDVSRALRVPGEASGIYLAALDTTGRSIRSFSSHVVIFKRLP